MAKGSAAFKVPDADASAAKVPANSMPEWACAASGFTSAVAIVWNIAWLLLVMTAGIDRVTRVVQADIFLFLAMTLLPIAIMFRVDGAFQAERMVLTRKANVVLGLSRVVGVTCVLILLRFHYLAALDADQQ